MDKHNHSHSEVEIHRAYLSAWIERICKNKLWEQREDLHLDQIEAKFEDKNLWVGASISTLGLLSKLIDGSNGCLLAIPFSCANTKTNSEDLSWGYVQSQLDLTPPSFYLFPRGDVNYERTIENLKPLKKLSDEIGYDVLFREYEEHGEYFRCLFVVDKT